MKILGSPMRILGSPMMMISSRTPRYFVLYHTQFVYDILLLYTNLLNRLMFQNMEVQITKSTKSPSSLSAIFIYVDLVDRVLVYIYFCLY